MNERSRRLLALLLGIGLGAPALAHEGNEHGNEPSHGGVVAQYKDIHYEVVAAAGGTLEVWFSDVERQALPAFVASDVIVEIEHVDRSVQPVDMRIGATGEYWVGQPELSEPINVVRVAFVYAGEPTMNDFEGSSLQAAPEQGGSGLDGGDRR